MNVFTGYHEGKCPKCNSEDIKYKDAGPNEDGADATEYWKNAICRDCGLKFVEWFELRYAESVSYENEEGKNEFPGREQEGKPETSGN